MSEHVVEAQNITGKPKAADPATAEPPAKIARVKNRQISR